MAASFDAKARTLGPATALADSVVIDRSGVAQLAVPGSGTAAYVAPDAGFMVVLVRGVTTPLMLRKRRVEWVRWHPDGKRLTLGGAYLSLFDPATGSDTRLTATGRPKQFASWGRDGRSLAYMTFEPSNDIYVLPLKEDGAPAGAPRPLVATDDARFSPAISPDGAWIAYRSVSNPELFCRFIRCSDATRPAAC